MPAPGARERILMPPFKHLLSGFLTLIALSGAACAAPAVREQVQAYRIAHERQILEEFMAFLALPNVATSLADVDRNAAYLEEALRARGLAPQLLRAQAGTPASVFAVIRAPGAKRTVLFYAHYDGQPVSQKGWISEPFRPAIRTALPDSQPVNWQDASAALDDNWRLFARSAGDDKVSIQALLSALDALRSQRRKLSVNVKLLYEGEEEQGSPHFAQLVAANAELLRCDLLIMGDGPMHQSGRQMINFGNRGFAGLTLTVYGAAQPLHDGHYGSWVPNPAVMMAGLIMSLRDDEGHILIPGFYDDVAPVSAADRAALAALPPVEADLKSALGLGRNIGPARLADGYLAPTLNVRALHSGDEGPNAANAIATEAQASLDFRLAPGETPAHVRELTENYLLGQGWFIVRDTPDAATRLAHPKIVKVVWEAGGALATKTALDLPASRAVAAAISRNVGYPVIELPLMGASSGMADIVKVLQVPMVGVSIANYDDNQHTRNENLRLGNLWDGIGVYAALLTDLNW
jgi:acetylornithine deacetylase/succinyl-diaminopimelate desuccinylase-like protein